LGTRAVNRVGGDYPRMIAVSNPELRPEIGRQIAKYSQKNVDLLDLEANEFATLPLREVISSLDYPNVNYFVSTLTEDFIDDSLYSSFDASSQKALLTFNNLIKNTAMVRIMNEVLSTLEKAWGQPVDIEFTAALTSLGKVRINLLQCRPLRLPRISASPVEVPGKLDARNILFRSSRIMSGGVIDAIRYIIYIDPEAYDGITTLDRKRSIGRVVGRLNEYFRGKEEKIIAVGPGRWGSNNIDLGVNVSYADIDNFMVLVEVGRAGSGAEPELSYGTHFFQDLVEADIIYIPVFPDSANTGLNVSFFTQSPNALAKILPEFADYADVIRVIDVPQARKGVHAHIIADAANRKAICYLR